MYFVFGKEIIMEKYIKDLGHFDQLTLDKVKEIETVNTHGNKGVFHVPMIFKGWDFIKNDLEQYSQTYNKRTCFVLTSLHANNLFTTPSKDYPIYPDKDGTPKFYDTPGKRFINEVPALNIKETKTLQQGMEMYKKNPKVYLRIPYGGDQLMDKYLNKFVSDFNFPSWVHSKNIQNFSWFLSHTGATTNLHRDITGGGFLLQIQGRKKILLAEPKYAKYLYPYDQQSMMYRRSQVYDDISQDNIRKEWEKQFPLLKKVKFKEIIVGPGEWLRIPEGWWHLVKSLDTPTWGVIIRMKEKKNIII